jgi:hypothetical protein
VDGVTGLANVAIWLALEAVLVDALLIATASPWRVPLPAAVREMLDAAPPLPGYVAWMLGAVGLAVALMLLPRGLETLRTLAGVDRLVLMADRFTSRRGIGPVGRERSFRPADLRWIAVKRAKGVFVQDGSREVAIASLGTAADHSWLVERLQQQYGIKGRSEWAQNAPPGWVLQPDTDGSVRLLEAPPVWWARLGCFGTVALVWWLIAGVVLYIRSMRGWSLTPLLFWVSVGVALLVGSYWESRSHVSFRVGRNLLVRESGFGPWKWRVEITDSELHIEHQVTRKLRDVFVLEAVHQGRWTRIASGDNQSGEVMALARYLSRQTGWRLEAPPQAGDRG